MNIQPILANIETLLLDPNNPRFLDLPGWKFVPKHRFAESGVQQKTETLLRDNSEFSLRVLRDSILENGWVPLEQIVIRPFESTPDLYVIVEGNRRIAAIR